MGNGVGVVLSVRLDSTNSWVWKIPWRRDRLPTPVFLDFPGGSAGKESTCNAGDLGSIPGLGKFPGGGKGYPLQYSGLENPTDGGAWQATVHGVAKSWTFTFNSDKEEASRTCEARSTSVEETGRSQRDRRKPTVARAQCVRRQRPAGSNRERWSGPDMEGLVGPGKAFEH